MQGGPTQRFEYVVGIKRGQPGAYERAESGLADATERSAIALKAIISRARAAEPSSRETLLRANRLCDRSHARRSRYLAAIHVMRYIERVASQFRVFRRGATLIRDRAETELSLLVEFASI